MSSTYCTTDDIANAYGTTNRDDWADLENTEVSATMTARINWAIGVAGDDIDSITLTQYNRVPIVNESDTVPTFIRDLAAILAGVKLYESRGIEDVDKQGDGRHRLTPMRDWAYGVLEQIRRGERKIPGVI